MLFITPTGRLYAVKEDALFKVADGADEWGNLETLQLQELDKVVGRRF